MKNENHFYPADILLPKKDFQKWAVVACDQYTSQPEYWDELENNIGATPSSLNIILPEARLGADDDKKISAINKTMQEYLQSGVFNTCNNTFIYVEREITGGKIRRGIVGLIDLEDYDYTKHSRSLIRATEATVLERIPPRVKIRKDAPLELPHVMLLADDKNKTVIEPLSVLKNDFERLYDFELCKNSGRICGYAVNNAVALQIQNAVSKLIDTDADGLLFAVGDGNHSLACAKECYKLNPNPLNRYALVEIVNIHDESLVFEPIYRTVFGCEPEALIDSFVKYCGGEYFGADAQKFQCVFGENTRTVSVKPTSKLCVGTLQDFLDKYALENGNIKIDYIHGADVTAELAKKPKTVGFIFDGMHKDELFDAIKQDGSLPKKTFSMGHASDKRFYIEARKIKP